MKKYESLTIRVGPKAYQEIQVNGLDIKKIKTKYLNYLLVMLEREPS